MSDWTILQVLDWTANRFAEAGLESPRLDAQVLLAHVLDCNRIALYTNFDKPLDESERQAYRELVRRRLRREPVAYLIGTREFWSLSLAVNPGVLVPRPDTETAVAKVLELVRGMDAVKPRILDVATGSGAIAVALASELPDAVVIATDVSPEAIRVATSNVERNQLADRVRCVLGDLLEPVSGEAPFDVIVANLPYIPTADIAGLSADVKYEPRLALDGGADGLDVIRRLVADAPSALVSGGWLVLEHGHDQAGDTATILHESGQFAEVSHGADLAGVERITIGRRL